MATYQWRVLQDIARRGSFPRRHVGDVAAHHSRSSSRALIRPNFDLEKCFLPIIRVKSRIAGNAAKRRSVDCAENEPLQRQSQRPAARGGGRRPQAAEHSLAVCGRSSCSGRACVDAREFVCLDLSAGGGRGNFNSLSLSSPVKSRRPILHASQHQAVIVSMRSCGRPWFTAAHDGAEAQRRSARTIQFATSDPPAPLMTAARASPLQPTHPLQPLAAGAPRLPRRRHSHPPFKRQRHSCMRATSAYSGAGSRLEELSPTRAVTVRFGAEPKKSLSFADQHGFRLEALREFSPQDAPTEFCDLEADQRLCRRRRSGSLDRWAADVVARQHLLSMCVVSCSILTCALIGLRQASK